MRKYLFSGALLGTMFSILGPIRATVAGGRRWRVALVWVAWLASLVAAILAVQEESHARNEDYE